MRKQFNLQLMNLSALLSVLMVLSACKKNKELIPSSATTVVTTYALNVSQTWATLQGGVTANNQSTIVTFEYDTTTSYKQSINATPDTIDGSIYTYESAYVTGLNPSTIYHFRLKAENSNGTTYGKDTTFTTAGTGGNRIIFNPDLTYGSVTDNDGNTYKTIQIGTQSWMAENLKTTIYKDGTPIPLVKVGTAWALLDTPGYCWYTNDSVSYGVLYNFYTVSTGKLCPLGWHIPSDAEWTTLTTYLGGESDAGNKQKETGLTHWQSPNTGATNESGYSALPGGYRNKDGSFTGIRKQGYWWSSDDISSVNAYYHVLFFDSGNADRGDSDKKDGFSVRCLQNLAK